MTNNAYPGRLELVWGKSAMILPGNCVFGCIQNTSFRRAFAICKTDLGLEDIQNEVWDGPPALIASDYKTNH
jgi:hypothetical protein